MNLDILCNFFTLFFTNSISKLKVCMVSQKPSDKIRNIVDFDLAGEAVKVF